MAINAPETEHDRCGGDEFQFGIGYNERSAAE
jgi:hypothetical protein